MSTQLNLINTALAKVGVSRFIVSITESIPEAAIPAKVYEGAVQETLRAFPWGFATTYAALALVTADPNSDWGFAYAYPSDCLFARRIVPPVPEEGARTPQRAPIAFRVGDGVIYTNEEDATLEYTARVTLESAPIIEPLFEDALTWNLASKLAPALSRIEGITEKCLQMYAAALALAQERSDSERQLGTLYSVVREALLKIGVRSSIAATGEPNQEAATGLAFFDQTVEEVLREYPWAFATKYADAADAETTGDPLELLEGSETEAANADWQFAYRLPDDYVTARRIVPPGGGRRFTRAPIEFRIGRTTTDNDDDVLVLFTDQADPVLEYTCLLDPAEFYGDALFRNALSWNLAAKLAPAFAPDKKMVTLALAMYGQALQRGATLDAREQQQPKLGDAEWIDGR